jgi:acyl-homoserine-lactone acylase
MQKNSILSLLIALPFFGFTQIINPANVEIVRDSFGIPHIFAKTDAEVAYGLAWANAEDDFKSVQELLLPAKGVMGAVQGKKGAVGDYVFSLFRCKQITEERWHTLTPAFLKLINGYVQGYNAYAKAHPKELLHKKLSTLTVKEYVSASVLALTIFNGADKALTEIFNNTIALAPQMENKGSNSFAIHRSRTTTDENYLLINAHQPNTGPQSFYEAHICSEEGLNITGGLLAGAPCILHGVNEHLGWAHTVNFCDRVDVFQLEMNPENANQYKFDGAWVDIEKQKIKLKIKGIPFKIGRTIYWSKYGATLKNKKGFFSIRLGGNMRIGALDQWYQMDKAKNYTQFVQALNAQELSMFNIMYADNQDSIFYINNALMPIRDTSNTYNWKKTVPGNTSKTLWTDFRKLSELPQYVNPSSGFLFNTNHSSFLATAKSAQLNHANYAKADGWEQYPLNRSTRIMELMPSTGTISFDAFKKIKFDLQLPQQLQYLYAVDSLFSLNITEYPELTGLITELKNWDKKGVIESKGAAIFLLAYIQLAKKLIGTPVRAVTKFEAVETLTYIKNYMLEHFGRTDITLGDIQKLVRGNKDYPLWGFPDLLSPQWTAPYTNGRVKSIGGDGLIMFIRFIKNELPYIESVNMYGASAHPESKHFDDQVPLYLKQQTKRMTLDKKEVYKKAERVYHPM